ncbi:hypothetical protein QQF64_023316 [Cirrhinus molitorella]|uniref:PiggyBac transposable element-derived protein 4 C-terminal zinc-ribbon domain-containing protein n=1 Tax=Cirrhinus molitorella TaxID=172907 RepID=A0ABR3L4U1_9TELE
MATLFYFIYSIIKHIPAYFNTVRIYCCGSGNLHHKVTAALEETKKRGPVGSSVSDEVRLDRIDHWPVMEKKGRCKYPGCKGIIRMKCSKCDTHLCITSERNCFLEFHMMT